MIKSVIKRFNFINRFCPITAQLIANIPLVQDFPLESSLGVCKVVSEKYRSECVFTITERAFKTMSETDELSSKLAHRQALNEDENLPRRQLKVFNPYTEFKEFSRKQIKDFEKMFKKYDVKNDHYLDLMEMKQMMEKLGAPQTHIGLKNMIAEIDEDNDGKVSFREFLLIFHKAAAGELSEDSGLSQLAKLAEVDVDEVGVGGAAKFFEAKAKEQAFSSKFEAEIRAEQEERKKQAEEAKARKAAFQAKKAAFGVS